MNHILFPWLKANSISFISEVKMRDHSWFGTGGQADLIVYPRTREEFVDVVAQCSLKDIDFKVIGETTNLLFLDESSFGVLISTVKLKTVEIDRAANEIRADCGVMLPDLSRRALLESAKGFAALEGIPGTIGGAIFMNAAAYGDSTHLVLKEVEVVTREGIIIRMTNEELDFSYRNSVFRDGRCGHFILRGIFHLRNGDQVALSQRMELVHAKRHKYHEYNYPNLGSIFAGSIYRALAKKSLSYWMVSSLFYLFNYKFKVFRRESPLNRRWLNEYTIKKFKLNYAKQPFSDKTMNTLVNNGQGSQVYVDYIRQIQGLIGDSVPIENEIVKEVEAAQYE